MIVEREGSMRGRGMVMKRESLIGEEEEDGGGSLIGEGCLT